MVNVLFLIKRDFFNTDPAVIQRYGIMGNGHVEIMLYWEPRRQTGLSRSCNANVLSFFFSRPIFGFDFLCTPLILEMINYCMH